MWTLGPIGFTAPWLLLGLLALPILWLLLRAVPPAPIRQRFPGVALLLGLTDDETETDRTPWWLLLLRMLAVAALIVGFAGPVLNPQVQTEGSDAPLLILMDGTWADAPDWDARLDRVEAALDQAARDDRVVAVAQTTGLPADGLEFLAPSGWLPRLAGLAPQPFLPDPAQIAAFGGALDGRFDTLWLADGLDYDGRDALLAALQSHGAVRAFQSGRIVYALSPARFATEVISLDLHRVGGAAPTAVINAIGPDPNGVERVLARVEAAFEQGQATALVDLSLPPELRNRVARFEVEGQRSAGAVSLTGDSLKRREVALVTARDDREGLELLSQLHYLQAALAETADILHGSLTDIIAANPDVIVLADVAQLSAGEADPLLEWVNGGGMLLRFAGPRLAASDISRDAEDPLMPVRLRAGGRTIGGAMSWGEPKSLRGFAETSPFYGLAIPEDVSVSAQVLAQPDPDLAARSIAALDDGTPLVTRKAVGDGVVVLFHVTANAEWSTLPLSGLFVQMLDRLAVSSRVAAPDLEALAGRTFQPDRILDGFGALRDGATRPPVAGEALADMHASRATPPGLYAGEEMRVALNTVPQDVRLSAYEWPASVSVEGLAVARETSLKPHLLMLALALLAVDMIATLALSGRLSGARVAVLALALVAPHNADAQSLDDKALAATNDVVLAHVLTGDARVDEVAQAGLLGLSNVLYNRTSVEPEAPVGIDLETDELAFYPLLYWPVTPDQPQPSAAAYTKLNAYLRTGGMIVFDTRDADIARFGDASPNGAMLQRLARPLDIPPLEPIPSDHVLTRTFYLLSDFPGRHSGTDVWVEAAPPDAQLQDGMPFRNLNDNVTPVVIGGNDWAGAWAVNESGQPLLPVGRGYAGQRQREIAYRFGVNLVMHVLTGNYKSDQVHVPALLDRLGQ